MLHWVNGHMPQFPCHSRVKFIPKYGHDVHGAAPGLLVNDDDRHTFPMALDMVPEAGKRS
jgi:hypothetical protein